MRRLILYCFSVVAIATLSAFMFYSNLYGYLKVNDSYVNHTIKYTKTSSKNDILFVGSSRVWVHVNPNQIDSITGLSSYNLALDGTNIVEHQMLIYSYLKHHPKPKYIFLNLDFLELDVNHETYNFPQFIPFLEDDSIDSLLKPYNPKFQSALKKTYYLYKWMSSLEDEAKLSSLFNTSFFTKKKLANYKGFFPVQKNWGRDAENKLKQKRKGIIHPKGVVILDSIQRECKRQQIELIGLVAPMHVRYKEVITNSEEIEKRIYEICEKMDIRLWEMTNLPLCSSDSYFYNSTHLNSRGAKIYSDSLGLKIKKEFLSAK